MVGQIKKTLQPQGLQGSFWLRGADLNHRPPGYEPDELPTALPRDMKTGILIFTVFRLELNVDHSDYLFGL